MPRVAVADLPPVLLVEGDFAIRTNGVAKANDNAGRRRPGDGVDVPLPRDLVAFLQACQPLVTVHFILPCVAVERWGGPSTATLGYRVFRPEAGYRLAGLAASCWNVFSGSGPNAAPSSGVKWTLYPRPTLRSSVTLTLRFDSSSP